MSVTFQTISQWRTGFNANFIIKNTIGSPVKDWRLEVDFGVAVEILALWDASLVSQVGSKCIFGPMSYNGILENAATITIGFNASPRLLSPPLSFILMRPAPLPTPTPTPTPTSDVKTILQINNQYAGGFGGTISLQNDSSETINGWKLTFLLNLDTQIQNLWNGVWSSDGQGVVTIQNESWNGRIGIGETVSVGFNAKGPITPQTLREPQVNGIRSTFTYINKVPLIPIQGIGVENVGDGDPWFTIPLQTQLELKLSLLKMAGPTTSWKVWPSNNRVTATISTSGKLLLTGQIPGRVSLRIIESVSQTTRYLGVRIRNGDGSLPGLPPYLTIGSVSEDTASDLDFFKDFDGVVATRKQVDIRYIYLTGGPFPESNWVSWSGTPGDRCRKFIRNSRMLGMVPYFVFYLLNGSGDSFETIRTNFNDANFMQAYFTNLKYVLDIFNVESSDDPVGLILEPDSLAYVIQNLGSEANQMRVLTECAYTAGILQHGTDTSFSNTLSGFVQCINYIVHTRAPQTVFGWMGNLWATQGAPSKGICHITDTSSTIEEGRKLIQLLATEIARFYKNVGVLTYGAHFLALDKYGLDAGLTNSDAPLHPENSTWFWNSTHWKNYLTVAECWHLENTLPIVLWQLPVGHMSNSKSISPYTGLRYSAVIENINKRGEDNAVAYFLGDSWVEPKLNRYQWFASNPDHDMKISSDASTNTITWLSHMEEAGAAGVCTILFGAGVSISTTGTGSPPTDDYFSISKIQNYFENPVSLRS